MFLKLNVDVLRIQEVNQFISCLDFWTSTKHSRMQGENLKASSICCQALIKGDSVTLRILPIGDARRNLPVSLILGCDVTWR